MQRIKVFGATLVALVALGAMTASASMALPEFSPATKQKFKGSGGAGELTTLTGGVSIKCTANTLAGEIITALTATVSITFTGCTALGLAANSLGDAEKVILTGTLNAELCYINKTTKPPEVGVYISGVNSHIEVPSLGILINVAGSLIGQVTPVNTLTTLFTFNFAQSGAGDQKVTECTNDKGEVLKGKLVSSKDAKHETLESSAIVQKAEVTAEKAVEIKA